MGNYSKNFDSSEFRCKCGKCRYAKDPEIDPREIAALEKLRAMLKEPIHILSGRRCLARNTACGGAKNSYHMRGEAADITCEKHTPQQVRDIARANIPEFRGCKAYGDRFTHLDVRTGKKWWP